jgi:hypothetical protein
MRRLLAVLLLVVSFGFIGERAASAQQSVNLFLGGFTPRSMDARGSDDVIYANSAFLSTLDSSSGININRFNGVSLGGEYVVGLGPFFDAAAGIGFYQRTAPTVYTSVVDQATGNDIPQDLKLRVIPFTATVRFLPLGRHEGIVPYVGGGVGVFNWRYSETGSFVDPGTNNIFQGNFVGTGTATGPVVLGGVQVPIGPVGVGGEIRWQSAKGTLPSDQGFAGSKIDLGGFNYLFVMSFRF